MYLEKLLRGCLHMKFHPGMKSSLFMVKFLLLFTRFHQDEISSRNELIPVKKTEMRFHHGMKKKKRRCVNTKHNFASFFTHLLNMLSNFNMFKHNESYKKYITRSIHKDCCPKNHYHLFCKVYKRLRFPFVFIIIV